MVWFTEAIVMPPCLPAHPHIFREAFLLMREAQHVMHVALADGSAVLHPTGSGHESATRSVSALIAFTAAVAYYCVRPSQPQLTRLPPSPGCSEDLSLASTDLRGL